MRIRTFTRVAGPAILISASLLDCAGPDRAVREADGEAQAARSPSAPVQPARGPGSSDYGHGTVTKRLRGEGADAYWLFQPADPVPSEAPLVLFLHGTRGLNPYDYGGWIEHLVRRGNIVIYPIFESAGPWKAAREGNLTQMNRAVQATLAAIDDLASNGSIQLRLDRFSITGHSFGGGLTGQIAARALDSGLPSPRAVMPVQPGWKGREAMPLDRLAGIPADALLLVVEGDEDQFADSRQGMEMIQAATAVPWDRKAFVRILSDERQGARLISDHAAPLSPNPDYGYPITGRKRWRRAMAAALTGMRGGEEDALDYLGYWKLFDMLCEAAFEGETIDKVVGSGTEASLGAWPDGTPLRPMKVVRTS